MSSRRGASLPSIRSSWPALPRDDQPEWLDQGRGDARDVAANLAEMARINRWLGGLSALTRHLYPRLLAATGPVTILDLGTGSADIPAHIAAWAEARGRAVRVVAIDWAARNLAAAQTLATSVCSRPTHCSRPSGPAAWTSSSHRSSSTTLLPTPRPACCGPPPGWRAAPSS